MGPTPGKLDNFEPKVMEVDGEPMIFSDSEHGGFLGEPAVKMFQGFFVMRSLSDKDVLRLDLKKMPIPNFNGWKIH